MIEHGPVQEYEKLDVVSPGRFTCHVVYPLTNQSTTHVYTPHLLQPRLSVINISSILLFDLFDSEPTNQPTVSHRISVNQSTNCESKILIGLVLFDSKRGRGIPR
jgi:hypothetical protein